jgi:hypothetical protein
MPTGIYIRSTQWREKQRNRVAVGFSRKGRKFGPHSPEHRRKLSVAHLGKKKGPFSEEWRKHLSECRMGDKNPNWKGGATERHLAERTSKKYNLWRLGVFERDKFTCQECKITGVYLEAHHIKSFAHFPEFRFELSNGITLCKECHKTKTNDSRRNK